MDRYDNSPPTLVDGTWSNGGAGVVSREEVYDRAKYFLEGVIPTAEKFNIQLACHLNDPPAPVLRGVEQWNYPVFEGIKRFSELVDSPMHGFNFCCGTAAEGLENPGVELYEIVEHFGRREQLFNIHFRSRSLGNRAKLMASPYMRASQRKFIDRCTCGPMLFADVKGGLHDFQEVWPDEGGKHATFRSHCYHRTLQQTAFARVELCFCPHDCVHLPQT